MQNLFSIFVTNLLVFSLLFSSLPAYAQNGASDEDKSAKANARSETINIRDLVLPSEVKGIGKSAGSIYYNPAVKGKALIPVHFWGAIGRSGLHYVPIDTNLVNGLSLAGGPNADAILSKIRVTRRLDKTIEEEYFNVSNGGDAKAFEYKLRPGDTIFLQKDNFLANRAYYTSLIGVIATILSSVLLFRRIEKKQ